MNVTENINVLGVDFIVFLQQNLSSRATFFMNVINYCDTSIIFSFLLPLVSALSLHEGITALWTLILCEWGTMIFKWIEAGDRPIWFIHESPYYLYKSFPLMRQFPLTCEVDPGTPDGQIALNVAFYFLITRSLTSKVLQYGPKLLSSGKCKWVNVVLWTVFWLWIGVFATSRVFVAVHFPHQCIMGVLLGIIIPLFVEATSYFQNFKVSTAFGVTILLSSTVFALFGAYWILGHNPMWPVTKAIRWCIKRDYVQIHSSPLYYLSRFSGLSLGFTWKMKLSLIILSVALGQSSMFIHKLLPKRSKGYYLLEFALNAGFSYITLCLLPSFVSTASGGRQKTKPKKK